MNHQAPRPSCIFMASTVCAAWLMVAGPIGAAPAAERMPNRPNILWLTCEDMSPNLGCYGDPYAVTPHLDRLAEESVLYTQAFAVAGVCTPARSCLITGVYPTSLACLARSNGCTIRVSVFR